MLDSAVGIFDDASILLAQQPGGKGQGQVAPLGLLLHACNQAAAQGMELDFAHDALHPEQQTAIGGRGIVDTVAVSNQTLIIVSPQKSGAESPCPSELSREREAGIMARPTSNFSPLE